MELLGEKGMVLSGIALLLVLPALLLSATFLTTVEIGGETTAIQGISDKIDFKAFDIKRTLRYRQVHGDRLDREAINKLEESYEKSAILGNIEINYSAFDIRVEYYDDSGNKIKEVHATDNACIIKNLKRNRWSYNFEASYGSDYDYNEPLLRLERLKNGNWKAKVAPTFTHSDVTANVWWGNQLIFEDVNENYDAEPVGSPPAQWAGEGKHEGESKIVSGTPDTVYIHINLEDPGGTVSYKETFPLRKPKKVEGEETKENLTYIGDAIAVDGLDGNSTDGGVEFTIKNNWDNTVTINQIEINPDHPDINGLSDKVGRGNNDPGEVEIYSEDEDGDGDAYSDFANGTDLTEPFSIGQEGYYKNGESPKVESGHEMTFYLYEFYDEWSYYYDEWIGNWDMHGEEVTITLTYEVRGNQKTKTFTITPL